MRFILEQVHQQGFKVVLNGQCGDETLLGYNRYYAPFFLNLIRGGSYGTFLREYCKAAKNSVQTPLSLLKIFAYFNSKKVRDVRQLRRSGRFVKHDLISCRNEDELYALLFPSSLEELQEKDLTATALTKIVRFDDRYYMSASLESRMPFMDYRFVELAAKIPAELKIHNGYTKYIMREVFDDRMPKAITWRTNKMGFNAPAEYWGTKFSKDYLMSQVEEARTAPFFHIDWLKKRIEAGDYDTAIYEFLWTELFSRQFGVC